MFIFLMFYFLSFVAFPPRNDAIFENNKNSEIKLDASGSLGLFYNNKCHMTLPNQTITFNKQLDWCSNIVSRGSTDMPWISYTIPGKLMKISAFSVRNGCCYYSCCCTETNGVIDYGCCCILYSFSILGSNDNKTWVTLKKVEKLKDFWSCKYLTFDIENNKNAFKYIKLRLDEGYPGCPICMQINQIEFYGETVYSGDQYQSFEDNENDESVSIIGKISNKNY